MLTKLRNRISRLLHGSVANYDFRDRLIQAQSKLDQEAIDMQHDVGKIGDRVDPVGTIIRNITKVRRGQ